MKSFVTILAVLLVVSTAKLSAGDHAAAERVDFNRDIRPLLSDHCLLCHGRDEQSREAELRLDNFDDATDSGAIVPGDPEASELLVRITSDDPDQIMPPPDSENSLTEAEVDLVRRWIEQGAKYQKHWAWEALTRPDVPNTVEGVPRDQSSASAIDAFLQAGWNENNVTPVGPASPRERLRRLSFDLRGLPPSAEEVATYEKDPSNKMFFEFRDRWMADLSYAEHQAVGWLDLVRWADTSGFVSDEPIASGAYRAWIIRAIHENMPMDQFSIAQLAGDLLPDPTDDQLIASGYNRIVNTNCEAGAIEEEQLYKLKGEHVRALGTVWMGMTTGCAECHDHKFDPFSAKDYYSLAAFFDDLIEAGVYTPGDRREPLHYVHDQPAASRQDKRLTESIAKLRKQIQAKPSDEFNAWEKEFKQRLNDSTGRADFAWIPAQLPAPRIVEGEFSIGEIDGKVVRETSAEEGQFHRHHAAEMMTGYLNQSSQKTDGLKDAWFADVWIDPDSRPEMLGLQVSNGRYGRLGWQTASYETYYWGNDSSEVLAKPHLWSEPGRVKRMGDLPNGSGWVRLRIPFDQLIKPVSGKSFESVGMAWLHTGGRVGWSDSGMELRNDKATALMLGATAVRKWWQRPKNRQVYQRRAEYVAESLNRNPNDRDDLQRQIVVDAFRENSQPELMEALRSLESELFVLRARAMPVLVSKSSGPRKTTRLLHRGDYQDTTGPIVGPAVPEFLATEALQDNPTRLDLAEWLFAEENPLFARVFMNRLWHQFYGRGISETLEDSGTQGDWPSNVALLDWLACEFRESGWDRNQMVRLLTSTKAYQLSSKPSTDLVLRDPGNRWHARQSRHRMTAEAIRDTSLHAAGLLKTTEEIPVQSFFPYQPDPYWSRSDKIMYGSRHMNWETSADRSQYHRSLYTFWKRQNIHPTMLAFDAPTRQECTAKRNVTNTPGQALALLNDPIFVESARVFAIRICGDADLSDEQRIENAYLIALQRLPSAAETEVLLDLLADQRRHYREFPDQARRLVAIGQSPPPSERDAANVAAWTIVTRTLLNLHEFLNRS